MAYASFTGVKRVVFFFMIVLGEEGPTEVGVKKGMRIRGGISILLRVKVCCRFSRVLTMGRGNEEIKVCYCLS